MTTSTIEQDHGGARVMFADGAAHLLQPGVPPQGTVPATASVISPGTELRRMNGSTTSPDHPAGYMNIAYRPDSGQVMLAPAPHGAWMCLDHPRALAAAAGTPLAVVATARFQLIAAIGLSHDAFHAPPAAVITGSGPVALGCCLELLRRGSQDLTLLTSRTEVPFASDLGIRITRAVPPGSAPVVIDATGRIETGLSAVAPGGTLGLLGTPHPVTAVSALHVHRHGLAVIGMHELLNYDHATYQHQYSGALAWLTATYGRDFPDRWCERLRESQVADYYRQLAEDGSEHGTRPITIVEWAS
jgi:threonine dehydrogenase-like Zn-dependent dehydrogenase